MKLYAPEQPYFCLRGWENTRCARKCAEESGICFDDAECVRLDCPEAVGEDGLSDSVLSRRLAIQDYLEKILNKTVCFGTAAK